MRQTSQAVLQPVATTLVRADQLRAGDVVGHLPVSVALQLAADLVAIVLETPSGPAIDHVRPDQMIRIRCREGAV